MCLLAKINIRRVLFSGKHGSPTKGQCELPRKQKGKQGALYLPTPVLLSSGNHLLVYILAALV